MKKKIQKPFDVEAAKNGARIETRSGYPARIICYDRVGNNYSIVALVNRGNIESYDCYTTTGHFYETKESEEDLFIIEEVEKTKFKEGDYIVSDIGNIYKITRIDDMYHTRQLSSSYEQRWTIEDIDRTFHKWSLSDAKPGDVLCCEDGRPFMLKELDCFGNPIAYSGINTIDKICEGDGSIWTYDKVRPATFREYNSLFEQLRKENYEYNVDTHEITKQEIAWRNNENATITGYYTEITSRIVYSKDHTNTKENYNIFATKKQAKSALAMAYISQIMANDERFGGFVTDEEWMHHDIYVILRHNNTLMVTTRHCYEYLGFNKREQAELFLKENEDLIKDYYMMD